MKKILIAILFLVLVAIVLIYVRNQNLSDANMPGITPMPLPEKTFHQSPRDYNRFAVESYLKIVRSKGDENAVFSPFSLSMAFEILYAGSRGTTSQALETLLHLPPGQTSPPQNPALFEYKAPDFEFYVLQDSGNLALYSTPPIFMVGNSIWYSNKLTINPVFAKNMKAAFFLDTFPVDVTTNQAQVASDMEQWANRVTQGLIPSINPEPPVESSITLLNTLYFKAHWENKFLTSKTKDKPFTLANGEIINVPTMCDEAGFPYMQNEELRALEMPYFSILKDSSDGTVYGEGYFSMLFILPSAVDGIYALEEKLSEEFLRDIVRSLRHAYLEVSIPKFRLEQENNLRTIFEDDGLIRDADYSGMFTPNLFTNDISAKQKIVLGIDENGTEAAAAMEIGLSVSLPGDEPPIFIVDHPFLFLIREQKTGTILFLGRVMNPNER